MRARKAQWAMLLALLVALSVLTIGCGRPGKIGDQTVLLREYQFNPSRLTVKAGQPVKFELRNAGAVVHDFAVPAISYNSRELAPNEKKTIEITFPSAGEYKLVCTVPGHEALGMVGKIVVVD